MKSQKIVYKHFDCKKDWFLEKQSELETLGKKFLGKSKEMPTVRDLRSAKGKVARLREEIVSFAEAPVPKLDMDGFEELAKLRSRVKKVEKSSWSLTNRW